MTVSQLKEDYRKQLLELGEKMTSNQKMQVAINMNVSYMTIERYQSGNMEQVRKVELAERIINECNSVLESAAKESLTQS